MVLSHRYPEEGNVPPGFHLTVEFHGWMEPVSWAIPGVWTDGREWVRERRDSTGPGLLGISSRHSSVFTLRTAKQPSVAGLILRAPHSFN